MPRTAITNVTLSTHKLKASEQPNPIGSFSGHTLTFYADKAIYDETAARFISPEDLDRKTNL